MERARSSAGVYIGIAADSRAIGAMLPETRLIGECHSHGKNPSVETPERGTGVSAPGTAEHLHRTPEHWQREVGLAGGAEQGWLSSLRRCGGAR